MGCEQLTYESLNRSANQLARKLRTHGVDPTNGQQCVGVCVNRSIDTFVAILGTLKAGAGYVPLDPGYPMERLQIMIEAAQPVALLTFAAMQEQFSKFIEGCAVICLDDPLVQAQHTALASNNLSNRGKTSDLTYVIFTSGSTGKPKGVCLPHSALVNLIEWQVLHRVCVTVCVSLCVCHCVCVTVCVTVYVSLCM